MWLFSLRFGKKVSVHFALLPNIIYFAEWVSTRVGDQDGMLTSIVTCVLVAPEQIREDHRYELVLLVTILVFRLL